MTAKAGGGAARLRTTWNGELAIVLADAKVCSAGGSAASEQTGKTQRGTQTQLSTKPCVYTSNNKCKKRERKHNKPYHGGKCIRAPVGRKGAAPAIL